MARSFRTVASGVKKPAATAKPPAKKVSGKRVPKTPTRKRSSRRALGNISNNADSDNNDINDDNEEKRVSKKKTARGRGRARKAASYQDKSESDSEAANSNNDEERDNDDYEDEKPASKKKSNAKKSTSRNIANTKKTLAAPQKKATSGGKEPSRVSRGGKRKSSREKVSANDAPRVGSSDEVTSHFTQKHYNESPKKKSKSARNVTPRSASSGGGDYLNVESPRKMSSQLKEELKAAMSDWRCTRAVDW